MATVAWPVTARSSVFKWGWPVFKHLEYFPESLTPWTRDHSHYLIVSTSLSSSLINVINCVRGITTRPSCFSRPSPRLWHLFCALLSCGILLPFRPLSCIHFPPSLGPNDGLGPQFQTRNKIWKMFPRTVLLLPFGIHHGLGPQEGRLPWFCTDEGRRPVWLSKALFQLWDSAVCWLDRMKNGTPAPTH